MTEAEWIAFLQRPEIPAFNRAMLDRPDDDLPRLVFADWMDENCPDSDVNEAVRESIPIKVGCVRWPGPDWRRQHSSPNLALVRGRLTVTVEVPETPPKRRPIRSLLDAAWCAEWVAEVSFGPIVRGSRLVRWFGNPHMAAVIRADFTGFDLSRDELRKMLHSPHLGHLRGLRWKWSRDPDPSRLVRELCDSPILGQLESLELDGLRLQAGPLRTLLSSFRRMRCLRLSSCVLPDETGQIVAGCAWLTTLSELHLPQGAVSPPGADALANSPYLSEAIRAQWS